MVISPEYDRASLSQPPSAAIPEERRQDVEDLFSVWDGVRGRNQRLSDYYRGHNVIRPLGISVPSQIEGKLRPVCGWAAKAVKSRTSRQVFDGYVTGSGGTDAFLDSMVRDNRLSQLQQMMDVSRLVYGMAAYTVMAGGEGQPPVVVRGFSAQQCAVIWDKDKGRVACGIVLSDVDGDGNATRYTAHFPDAVLDMRRDGSRWSCYEQENPMGRPLMEVITHDPDLDRPLGHSLLTPEVLDIIDKSLRDLARMEIASEFFAFPQRYLLNVADDIFLPQGDGSAESSDASAEASQAEVDAEKLHAYLGTYLTITKDEDGTTPVVGQFPAADPAAFTSAFENDAQRFSGATNVPLAQLGVLSNNYTSSDALSATNDPLIQEVEADNRSAAFALEEVARMALAIEEDVPLSSVGSRGDVQAQFLDPSMPTIASRADAWSKIGSVDSSVVGTRVFYEGMGLSKATIDRLENEKRRASITSSLNALAQQQQQPQQPQQPQQAQEPAQPQGQGEEADVG